MRWEAFYSQAQNTVVGPFLDALRATLMQLEKRTPHGRQPEWDTHYERLCVLRAEQVMLSQSVVQFGRPGELSSQQQVGLRQALEALIPWRKGPFEVFGESIDCWSLGNRITVASQCRRFIISDKKNNILISAK